ncbi:MAG: glycosyltransferase family 4 protein [Acidimicrobiales bacterium]
MRLIFVAPSTRHPSGGVAVIYEMAAALATRGHDVHLYHVNFFDGTIATVDEIGWFPFPDGITHHFTPAGPRDLQAIPHGDVFFGFSFDRNMAPQSGLPVVLIQGWQMLGHEVERHAYEAPCPKLCVAGWLVDVGRDLGVPANELVHVPIGIHHETYRVTRPIAERPRRVSFCYSSHPTKGPQLAMDVVGEVKRALPGVEVVAFGAQPPEHDLPAWVAYVTQPSSHYLVDEIYNTSRVFLCTSRLEGFGLANVEAMACGAALVTTSNGGSRDYALPGETALVGAYRDVAGLSQHVITLLEDDDRRTTIASTGRDYVQRFDWWRTGELLEAFLEKYVADPAAYGHGVRQV